MAYQLRCAKAALSICKGCVSARFEHPVVCTKCAGKTAGLFALPRPLPLAYTRAMPSLPRRDFLTGSLATVALASCSPKCGSPAAIAPDSARPLLPCGVQTGDPTPDGVILWSKTDRPARMLVEWSADAAFKTTTRLEANVTTAASDFTSQIQLSGLPPGKRIYYRVVFEADDSGRAKSEPASGSFRAVPIDNTNTRLVWSGDTAGQGFGIDLARGGMKTYGAITRLSPDLFLHSGDRIYADNPLPERIKLADGTEWKNLLTDAKQHVAQTLADFRGNFSYNFLDEHVRRLSASCAMIAQWDDHEVHNNWYPGEILQDDRYQERRASVLAGFARQAMEEYSPKRKGPIHRLLRQGPRLSIYVLDARSFRNPNGKNREEQGEAPILGKDQVDWLLREIQKDNATWKIIACDQPLGLIIPDPAGQEGFANEDGPPLGREREIASILTTLKQNKIKNLLWLTADVHYAAAHHYDPQRALFKDFDPFWEFVAGPLHAGTFGPNQLDSTFGPEVKFINREPGAKQNLWPSASSQSFGKLDVDGKSGHLRATLHDGDGAEMWGVDLEPV